jgi:glutathionylspermidine synthase
MARPAPLPDRAFGVADRRLADHLLLHWAQQSAPGEESVATAEPVWIDPALHRELARTGAALDHLLRRLADGLLSGDPALAGFSPPEFPLAKDIYARGPLASPFFWGRFDIFERAGGGLAVLEYNCDKPAGQREIWASGAVGSARGNPNRHARMRFRRALARAWHVHSRGACRRPRLAILADPAHREEFRLAYLFGREAAALGWPWNVVGPANLTVDEGVPWAYGEPVDIVLRQYPAEYLHELPAASALLEAARDGHLLWLNDPRAVVAQSKSMLAALWSLAGGAQWLTRREAVLVRHVVPPTGLASQLGWLERARSRPEDWVLKPVLGRYSERVATGALSTSGEWQAALDAATTSPDEWIVQAFVPPRRRWLPGPTGARAGYVNWGVYLTDGEVSGLCPRLQPTPLTEEGTTWWAPPVLRRGRGTRPAAREPGRAAMRGAGPGSVWRGIADRLTLAGYTNVWTDGLANFSLAAIELPPADWDELSHATLVLGQAVGHVLSHMTARPELLGVLGIPPGLASLAAAVEAPEDWSFLSRFDWARTRDGHWKLLEINSDTPAGLWETGSAEAEVARLHRASRGLSGGFWPALVSAWRRWAERKLGPGSATRRLRIGLVGLLASPEDQDQLRAHARAAREALPNASIEMGTPEDVRIETRGATLGGRRVDLLFRYYPLEWLAAPRHGPLLEAVGSGALAMLPPAHALIPQSKAFLALAWELEAQGFFPPTEAAAIRQYVARTALTPGPLGRGPYVIKPYLEREGHGVRFSTELSPRKRRRLVDGPVVCQEQLDVLAARVPVATARGWTRESRHLIFGVFLAGREIAGIYTRAGARVTGREAVYLPAVVPAAAPLTG